MERGSENQIRGLEGLDSWHQQSEICAAIAVFVQFKLFLVEPYVAGGAAEAITADELQFFRHRAQIDPVLAMEPEQVIRSALACGGLLNASLDQGVFVFSADQHIRPEASGQLIFALEADQHVGLITAFDGIGTIQADLYVDVGGQQFCGQTDLPGFDAEVLEVL